MKWIYFVGGGLALLAAIVALIGAMLPRDHRVTRQARYRQKPEAIYLTLAGPLDWRSDVKASGDLPDREGRKQWWEQDSHGHKVTYELVEDKMPWRRVTRIAEKNLAFGGTWTIEIFPTAEGSVVCITEDGEIYNVIFRFMARFFFGYTSTIEGYLRDLGHRFGELTTIDP
ncbi:MAG: hypothetical protein NTW28_04870 [Candidatus Solibacter sp.]|nr:hypothetical protein [Candidatus Solibacter sp.]